MSAATSQGEDPAVQIGNLCRSQIQKDACTERCLKHFQAVTSTFICFLAERAPLLNLYGEHEATATGRLALGQCH